MTFSSDAKLVLLVELTDDDVYIMVKDGTNQVDFTSYFDVDFDNDPVVETSAERLDTGTFSVTRYQLMKLKVHDAGSFGSLGIHFDTEGLATVKRKTLAYGGTLYLVDRPTGKVVGDGKSDKDGGGDEDFLAALTFSVTGGTVEVVP